MGPPRSGGGLGGVVPPGQAEPPLDGQRRERAAEGERGRGERHRALAEQPGSQHPADLERRHPQRRRPARVVRGPVEPDHLAALGDLLAERVQDPAGGALQLIQRGQGHPGRRHPLRVLLLGRRAGPHRVRARPGRVLHGRQRGGQRVGQRIHPARGRVAEVDGERGRRLAQPVGHGRGGALGGGGLGQPPGAAGGRVHRGTRQLPRRGRGDPVHQVVRLVDDDHVVLGQHVDVGGGVDRQQRVVGHHDVRPGRRVPRPLGETAGAERAALRADALLRAHRDLAPGRLGHAGHQLVPVAGRGLLGPLVQPLDLPSQRRGGASVGRVEQRVLRVLGHAAALPVQAQVVAPALQDGEGRLPAEQRRQGRGPGAAGRGRSAGAAARWWRWPPRPCCPWSARAAPPGPGRPATSRCRCRPARPGARRSRWPAVPPRPS